MSESKLASGVCPRGHDQAVYGATLKSGKQAGGLYCRQCKTDGMAAWRRGRQATEAGRSALRAQSRELQKKRNLRMRAAVLDHYGRACACCGEAIEVFLTVDHVNDDGAEHRRRERISGSTSFYSWLVRNNFPPQFQTLCFNCNTAKSRGGCPHGSGD